jgi:phenylalanyl-tRNA synthetase beta subunit
VRGGTGDLEENVEIVDHSVHPKTGLESHCCCITYRSMDQGLTDEESASFKNYFATELARNLKNLSSCGDAIQ